MAGGLKALVAGAALATAGCASDDRLSIRALPDPYAKAARSGGSDLAEARALLQLGSVGLAIEGFRKAHRERPDSFEALAGLAESYERMGRHDLARANYEAALAIAPNNAALLRTFAASLQRQGKHAEARGLRKEAEGVTAIDGGPSKSAMVETDRPSPMAAVAPAVRPARPAAAAPEPPTAAPGEPAATERVAEIALDRPAASVTVKLPPARPWQSPTPKAGSGPAAEKTAGGARVTASGPRLQRMSLVEVALVTNNEPRWRPELVRRTAQSTTVRFVPLAPTEHRISIRLLNAARSEGLAARTRALLNRKGWDRVTIGNSSRAREKSLVLYSKSTAEAARGLAAEFGIGIAKSPRPGRLTILLGRDAVPISRSTG